MLKSGSSPGIWLVSADVRSRVDLAGELMACGFEEMSPAIARDWFWTTGLPSTLLLLDCCSSNVDALVITLLSLNGGCIVLGVETDSPDSESLVESELLESESELSLSLVEVPALLGVRRLLMSGSENV